MAIVLSGHYGADIDTVQNLLLIRSGSTDGIRFLYFSLLCLPIAITLTMEESFSSYSVFKLATTCIFLIFN